MWVEPKWNHSLCATELQASMNLGSDLTKTQAISINPFRNFWSFRASRKAFNNSQPVTLRPRPVSSVRTRNALTNTYSVVHVTGFWMLSNTQNFHCAKTDRCNFHCRKCGRNLDTEKRWKPEERRNCIQEKPQRYRKVKARCTKIRQVGTCDHFPPHITRVRSDGKPQVFHQTTGEISSLSIKFFDCNKR